MQQPDLPQSRHFDLQQLTDGTYATIARDGGWAVSNAGLIDLGHEALVFDTLLTPRAAHDLRLFSQYLLRRSPDFVVNSHYHNDHIWGNQAFLPGAHVVSTNKTRELILTAGAQELREYTAESPQQYAVWQRRHEQAADEKARAAARLWLGYYEGLAEELPNLQVCPPTVTFDDRLSLYGATGEARLISFAGAHTGSDTVLYLPQQGVVFMSDLLFVGCHPYLADGDPERWVQVLKEVRRIDARQFVPGHGPVGTRGDLDRLIAYIEHCMEAARSIVRDGADGADGTGGELPGVPDVYADWLLPGFYASNLRFLCSRLQAV